MLAKGSQPTVSEKGVGWLWLSSGTEHERERETPSGPVKQNFSPPWFGPPQLVKSDLNIIYLTMILRTFLYHIDEFHLSKP